MNLVIFIVVLYLLIGALVPVGMLWWDGKGKTKGQELNVNVGEFFPILFTSLLFWPVLYPAFAYYSIKENNNKIKKFW